MIQNGFIHYAIPIQYLYNHGEILILDVCCKRRLDIVCALAAQDDYQTLQYIFIYSAFAYFRVSASALKPIRDRREVVE